MNTLARLAELKAQSDLRKASMDQQIQNFLPGYESVTNASFYSRVALGNPLTANGGVYQYFGDKGGQFNVTSNFPLPGQLPSNMGFVAWAYRFELQSQDINDVMTAFQDGSFAINIAEYYYKRGHGMELFKYYPGISQSSTAQIGATGIALTAGHGHASGEGGTIELREPIPLTSQIQVSASVTLLTDVAGLHGAITKFRLIGTLARKITG